MVAYPVFFMATFNSYSRSSNCVIVKFPFSFSCTFCARTHKHEDTNRNGQFYCQQQSIWLIESCESKQCTNNGELFLLFVAADVVVVVDVCLPRFHDPGQEWNFISIQLFILELCWGPFCLLLVVFSLFQLLFTQLFLLELVSFFLLFRLSFPCMAPPNTQHTHYSQQTVNLILYPSNVHEMYKSTRIEYIEWQNRSVHRFVFIFIL